MTYETEDDALGDGGDTAVDEKISKPGPEKYLSYKFEDPLLAVEFCAEVAEDKVPG